MSHKDVAQDVITKQSDALKILSQTIPADFEKLVEYILNLKGRVILVGLGKSGYIAKKIAASLASTGTPAFFIHPSEASHGDLGMITNKDLVIMISNSGKTKELFDTINYCKRHNIKIASITMKKKSILATNSDFILNLPTQKESAKIAAPTTSALMTLSLGDALVTSLHRSRGFNEDDFKLLHPAGQIGVNLLKAKDLMRTGSEMPVVNLDEKFSNVILTISEKCIGCAIVISKNDEIKGIITDGDLRRHINQPLSSLTAEDVMTSSPQTIGANILATEALFIMNDKKIMSLAVIENNLLTGVLHIHDILKAGIS